MCQVSDRSSSVSDSDVRGEDTNAKAGDGRREETVPDAISKIKAANRKVKLINILRHYGVRVVNNPQRPEWSNNIICPFPSHKGGNERTPSFAYNFKDSRFYCFGCGCAGQAVEFISLKEGVRRVVVAERILGQYGEDISGEDFEDQNPAIEKELLALSKEIQIYIQAHKDNPAAMRLADKLMQYFDQYLVSKAPNNRIFLDELKYRAERIKELLSQKGS